MFESLDSEFIESGDPYSLELDLDNYEDFEAEELPQLTNPYKVQFLNNTDYNLNSPLLTDELDSVISQFTYRPSNKLFAQQDLGDKLDWYNSIKHPSKSLKKTSELHSWFGSINLSKVADLSPTREFLKEVDLDAEETFWVPKSFLRGWLNLEVRYRQRHKVCSDTLKWLSLFLEVNTKHITIIIILSHFDPYVAKKL